MSGSYAPGRVAAVETVVGVGQMSVTAAQRDRIVTYALGSCLGITIYDPSVRVGGMLHVMLPQGSSPEDRAPSRAAMFVDSGVPKLFKACYALGAEKQRIVLTVAGGAALRQNEGNDDFFQIGRRNIAMLRKMLWKNGVLIAAEELGGHQSRTMRLDIASGRVTIHSEGRESTLYCGEEGR